MNPQFINIYDITEETYLNWATHPIGEVAKKNARGMRILFIVETIVAVALAVYGFFTTNPLFLIVGGIAITYFIIKRFVLDSMKYRRQFREIMMRKKAKVWHREMRFTDEQIEINDSGEELVLEYSRIIDITEEGEWFCLWLNPASAYRVKRDGFTQGTVSGFMGYIKNRIKK